MSGVNAADILRQLHETAQAVREGKLDPESAMAVAMIGAKQVDVMRTMIDYMSVSNDAKLIEASGDVFLGTENPKQITHEGAARRSKP